MTNIFSRFRDIVSSNINAMLDRAEDPEKMIKLMITEMEDTLVEIKSACASAMAGRKLVERTMGEAKERAEIWSAKAEMALNKGREDLAREALYEKRGCLAKVEAWETEISQTQALIDQYQGEITQIEEKLAAAREKQRVLVARHIHAHTKRKAQAEIRRVETSDAFLRFEQFENRIERLESEAELVNYARKSALDQELAKLEKDEELERELNALKSRLRGGN